MIEGDHVAYDLIRRGGWITDFPGDCNIYASIDCTFNAIDNMIGGSKTRRPPEYRIKKGIVIIGVK